MGVFQRLFSRSKPGSGAEAVPKRERHARAEATARHLREFTSERRGVEMWVEPPTTWARPSVLLVAHDGEWTRRSVDSVKAANHLAKELGVPRFDAGIVPYPERMRTYNARKKREENDRR